MTAIHLIPRANMAQLLCAHSRLNIHFRCTSLFKELTEEANIKKDYMISSNNANIVPAIRDRD